MEYGNKNTDYNWCLQCNSQRFQQNFRNLTSGNKEIDAIIQESQSNCTTKYSFVEWIPYSKFEDIKYIDKGGFGKIYSAIWMEGFITNTVFWYYTRSRDKELYICDAVYGGLYYMHDETNLIHRDLHIGNILSIDYETSLITTLEFLKDLKSEQRPTTKELLIDFENYCNNIRYKVKESEIWKQIEECDRLNLTNPVDNITIIQIVQHHMKYIDQQFTLVDVMKYRNPIKGIIVWGEY
ncbi:hypothetical protein Glove_162g62 [Diversispora epigaea]|uniref:Protein kinase domain-containing protein n=1 Tax=Diversispora epigaea TaxID=1348612 RepID=A0A397J0C2_9GLOM|nr:hypothetical protein Glove_162g62 [Diversispora epigaea]